MPERRYQEVVEAIQARNFRQGTQWVLLATFITQALFFANYCLHLNSYSARSQGLAAAQLLACLMLILLFKTQVSEVRPACRWVRVGLAACCGLAWSTLSINIVESWMEFQSTKQIFVLGCLSMVIGWYTSRTMLAIGTSMIMLSFVYLTYLYSGFQSVTTYLSVLKFPVLVLLSAHFLRKWYFFGMDRYTENLKLIARFKQETYLDPLTNVANRRGFDKVLAEAVTQPGRHGNRFCLVLIDIDYFKLYNDNLGHDYGDHCLRKVAQLLQSVVDRNNDSLCRIGGEEFAVLLDGCDLRAAEQVVTAMIAALRRDNIPHPASPVSHRVSVSVGVAQWRAGDTQQTLFRRADQALFAAKRNGRDGWVSDDGGLPASSPVPAELKEQQY
ncbi:GGDEF domain-containing protein [Ferrimonas sp. SCSIO 43195]|uniref:GGDEF domain-containing protein n=1 Tax=Ferrimonas sp. SCSIO 43195 TaxID=2822844 RepID=UPI002075318F|nr:membrane-associated sensor domain-containing protein [Ferrimonas sp. SCSIO 43195]USD38848.1 membrane-associated sensor domain-containing protein [Ferrimonas sp. SCSIO 43195]